MSSVSVLSVVSSVLSVLGSGGGAVSLGCLLRFVFSFSGSCGWGSGVQGSVVTPGALVGGCEVGGGVVGSCVEECFDEGVDGEVVFCVGGGLVVAPPCPATGHHAHLW